MALDEKSEIRSVADMMTIRSGFRVSLAEDKPFDSRHFFSRILVTRDNKPMRTSVLTPRSCASSTITTLYLDSRKSVAISRKRTPSVMNLTQVSGEVVDEYRI